MAILLTFFTEKTVIFHTKKHYFSVMVCTVFLLIFTHSEKKHYFSVMVCTVYLLMLTHSEKKRYFSVMVCTVFVNVRLSLVYTDEASLFSNGSAKVQVYPSYHYLQ